MKDFDTSIIREQLQAIRGDVKGTVAAYMAQVDESTDRVKLKRELKNALMYKRLSDFERNVYHALVYQL